MTNFKIIEDKTQELIKAGTIGETDEIHTYAGWAQLGFQVKKGEHAIAKFEIWKHGKKKVPDGMSEEEAQAKGYFFRKRAAWFSTSQVEEAGVQTPELLPA